MLDKQTGFKILNIFQRGKYLVAYVLKSLVEDTLLFTHSVCFGRKEIIVIPWVVRLYVEIIHEL